MLLARAAIVILLALGACGDSGNALAPPPLPLETTIARALTARVHTPVIARCAQVAGVPVMCEAVLADGFAVPIALERDGTHTRWRIPRPFIDTTAIAAYVDSALAELGVAQRATCGRAIDRVPPGERLACHLSGGGVAFVDLGDRVKLELALDPETAAIRTIAAPDDDLLRRSRALDRPSCSVRKEGSSSESCPPIEAGEP